MANFTDIVRKQRKSGAGIGSSLATAFSERARERLDPRNYLFNRKGLATSLFPSLKGYQAGGMGAEKLKEKSATPDAAVTTINDGLSVLKAQFRIVAKNSIVLPQMARDTNLMKQNIAKLVRAQGDTPAKKADAFFQRAGDRESQYENAIKAGKPTPEKEVKKEDKGGGFLQKIFGFLLAPITLLVKLFSSILGTLTGGLKKLSEVIGSILSLASTAGLINTAKNVTKGVVGVGRGLAAAAAGTGALVANAAGKVFGGSKPSASVDTKGKPLTDFGTTGRSREVVKNKSLWGRFLAFVERKSPKLFARIGARLATAGTLATVPIIGWVASAIQIGLGLWTAYELYELWKEFNGLPEEQNTLSPEQMKNLDTSGGMDDAALGRNMDTSSSGQQSNTPQRQMISGESIRDVIGQSEGGKTGYNASYGFGAGKQDPKIKSLYGSKYGENVQLTDLTIADALKYAKGRGGNQGALGKYQFMPSVVEGLLSGASLNLTDKFSAENQDKLYNVYSQRNTKALEKGLQGTGIPITADVLHLAHSVGAGGAIKLLKHGDQNAKVADVLGLKGAARSTNPQLEQSISQYRNQLAGKYSASTPVAAASTSSMSASGIEYAGGVDMEYDSDRIKSIANYRKSVPELLSTQNKGAGVVVNDVKNINNQSAGGSSSPGVAANVYDDSIIKLMIMAITDSNFSGATR
jgi:hypothetical protein